MATVSPAAGPVQPGSLKSLEGFLWDHHYSVHCIDRIVAHAAEEGTPTGCPELDPEDEELATEAFVAAMTPTSQCSNAWDDAGIWIDVDTLLEAGRPAIPVDRLVPPELDPEPYEPTAADELFAAAMAAASESFRESLSPSSGSPVIGGSAPSAPAGTAGPKDSRTQGLKDEAPAAEDWAEYREWAERLGRMDEILDDPSYGSL